MHLNIHDIITAMWANGLRLFTSAGLILSVGGGCASVPYRPAATARGVLSEDLRAYYQYPKVTLLPKYDPAEERAGGYRFQRLQLAPADDANFRPIKVDWYQPRKTGRHPLIILLPILAGNDLYVREFAKFFAARNLNAVIVYRPKEIFSADRPLADVETHFRESMAGLRQTIDWLETQESVDATRIGLFGISLGAILATNLAAVEPRIQASVLGLPAGHVPEILISSQDKAIRKRRRAYLEKHQWTEEQALAELQKVILSDPIKLAPYVNRDRVLMIIGVFDRVLGLGRSIDLWKALGRPRLILLPTGHYTAYFATPYLKMATYSFLVRQLKHSAH